MNEQFNEFAPQLNEEKEEPMKEPVAETAPLHEEVHSTQRNSETPVVTKKNAKKKTIIICAVSLVLILAAAIAFVVLHESELERVQSECTKLGGITGGGGDYFTIDTIPDDWDKMDSTVRALMLAQMQDGMLEAIRYANKALGFNGSLYSKMMETTAMMGRQTEENKKYRVSWKYHPDDGLEVTYEKK